MYKLVRFNADNGDREEQGALDLLMEFLNTGYDVGQFCEFGESVPELLITLPSAAFQRLVMLRNTRSTRVVFTESIRNQDCHTLSTIIREQALERRASNLLFNKASRVALYRFATRRKL